MTEISPQCVPDKIDCPNCRAAIDRGDCYCRVCGAAVAVLDTPPVLASVVDAPAARCVTRTASHNPRHDNVWFVLLMLLVVLGPLAIPMLWRSSAFSRPAKILLTVLVGVLTVVVIVLLWRVVDLFLIRMRELNSLLKM